MAIIYFTNEGYKLGKFGFHGASLSLFYSDALHITLTQDAKQDAKFPHSGLSLGHVVNSR